MPRARYHLRKARGFQKTAYRAAAAAAKKKKLQVDVN